MPNALLCTLLLLTILPPTPLRAQTPAQADAEVLDSIHEFHRRQDGLLRSCIREVFGGNARRLPRTRPGDIAFDFTRDSRQLSALRARYHQGRRISGLPVPAPWGGPEGTIIVARELHPSIAPEEFLRVYVHELGNLLDYSLHPDLGSPRVMAHYGRPNDASGDPDTGQQLERCVELRRGFRIDRK